MSEILTITTSERAAWGTAPSQRYEQLAAHFRPLFDELAVGAAQRERSRTLPISEIEKIKKSGFTRLRLPEEEGGFGASLPEFFALLTELSAADSNITQILRVHFAFVEDVLNSDSAVLRAKWLPLIAKGDIWGSAVTELGDLSNEAFATKLLAHENGYVLDGKKYYSTGSLFADWIDVGASNQANENIFVIVDRHAEGVKIIDDWDGFGQRLTASGTAIFDKVAVQEDHILETANRFPYFMQFFQLYHLATIAGISRALTNETAQIVAKRLRTFSHAPANLPKDDAQILQVIGKIRSQAYGVGAIVSKAVEALEQVYIKNLTSTPEDSLSEIVAIAEVEVSQAQTTVIDMALNASSLLFDALGASATKVSAGLDRHWRNIRTLSSHNPRIYKERVVGDFAVNGTVPPGQWRTGVK